MLKLRDGYEQFTWVNGNTHYSDRVRGCANAPSVYVTAFGVVTIYLTFPRDKRDGPPKGKRVASIRKAHEWLIKNGHESMWEEVD